MPRLNADEKAERKLRLAEKREARRLEKERKKESQPPSSSAKKNPATADASEPCLFLQLVPEDALQLIMAFLPSQDVGCLTMTCRFLNQLLGRARVVYILSRLSPQHQGMESSDGIHGHVSKKILTSWELCSTEAEARQILKESLWGDTDRLVTPKTQQSVSSSKTSSSPRTCADEFVAYARFLDEACGGYAKLSIRQQQKRILLPHWVNGRFVSCSPEHSLCRVGGGGSVGAGGSGLAAWGVGKRGQLGHGVRQDEKVPRRLLGMGYNTGGGIRIVQVAAGGGLVRVAHSLLLTSTGRVLSFGSGQYGALGHGYSAGKQLPDALRPQYIDALLPYTCVCVAAGELHSAAVTVDGDVFTWGDGFCGQLGHGDKRPQLTPKQVTKGGLEDECVSMISCGSRHSLAVTEDGEVFSWGLGHFGVLGREYTPFDYDADAAVVSFTGEDADPGMPPMQAAVPPALAMAPAAQDNAVPAAVAGADGGNFAAELIAHLDLIANLSLEDSSTQCIPMAIDSLDGVTVVGAAAGHRHSLVLDNNGCLYSFGAGSAGCLGHGDTVSQMYPLRIQQFVDENVKIMQMSAGVDMSMAVASTGTVYAWGKRDGGRLGLGLARGSVLLPVKVPLTRQGEDGDPVPIKAVDVECSYVHSLIVGLDGTVHLCGGVGTDGERDGADINADKTDGCPKQLESFNIWHRVPEPKSATKTQKWKKYGKYELKGRSKMMNETYTHSF